MAQSFIKERIVREVTSSAAYETSDLTFHGGDFSVLLVPLEISKLLTQRKKLMIRHKGSITDSRKSSFEVHLSSTRLLVQKDAETRNERERHAAS